jgi:putative tryptophan/tyrosine transport system substrate-binding protein
MGQMKRREFIALLGGAAAWPLTARAQQSERVRRIGVLMNTAPDSPDGQARFAAFLQGLQQFGWIPGRNVRLEVRWAAGDADLVRRYAAELVALAPDVILAYTSPIVVALQQATRTVPVQAPIKYELVINLKSAKALGLTVPDSLLARADEVIE